jgi:hypothetical protein
VASKSKLLRAPWNLSEVSGAQSRRVKKTLRDRTGGIAGRELDALAREAIDRCAGLIADCGYSPEQSARRFQSRCDRVSTAVVGRSASIAKDIDLTAHVLTLWLQEGEYLLPNGQPRPLRANGPAPSIEALVNKVGHGLTLKTALANLSSTASLRRVGRMYLPSDGWVSHPSNSPSQHAHHMRVFVEFLRTLGNNTRARNMGERWYQYAADNTAIPVSQFAALNRYLRRTGHAFLKDKDAFMYRLARSRKNGEPTMPVSIGVYLSQPRLPSAPTRRRPRKAK